MMKIWKEKINGGQGEKLSSEKDSVRAEGVFIPMEMSTPASTAVIQQTVFFHCYTKHEEGCEKHREK